MVEAFHRAGKTYDLIVLPEKGHASREVYLRDDIRRYFQEHLKPELGPAEEVAVSGNR